MNRPERFVTCKLCVGAGALRSRTGDFDAIDCPDCDASGFIPEGSEIHAQQLKIARNKKLRAA